MKFRKKPVVIDAWPISELLLDWNNMRTQPPHIAQAMNSGLLRFVPNGIYITTLEGGVFGRPEDVLIMGVAGEFYACKPDIFAATYEEVR